MPNKSQALSFVYLKVSSNQNNSNEEPNAVPANEQNELPANTPQSSLENEHASSPETPPLILQTEPPMEVHAHTHTPRKKWTHYFWEFLMLFLAVTLGFFVENQREHYIEHERAKELAGSLYEEMRSDSANLSKMIENRKNKESHLRYLSKYFKDSSLYKLSGAFYYRFTWGVFQTSYIAFEPKDGILQQLRNSGSLRYFRNIEIQKAVGDFSVALNNLRTRLERETNLFIGKNRDFLLEHYDFSWIMAMAYDNDVLPIHALKKYETDQQSVAAVIRGVDKLDRIEIVNHLDYYRAVLSSTRLGQMLQYQKASNHLVQLLRKEYHLSESISLEK